MCRKYSGGDSHGRSFKLAVNPQAQASFPPLLVRTITQPIAPADREKKVIDTQNLDEQDLKNLREYDAFLYYSIFTAAQDAKVESNEELQIQNPRQDGSHQSSNDSNPNPTVAAAVTITTTSTMVERKTRISCECHPDLLLDSLLDDESDYAVEHEHEDCAVDPILKFVYRMTMSNDSK